MRSDECLKNSFLTVEMVDDGNNETHSPIKEQQARTWDCYVRHTNPRPQSVSPPNGSQVKIDWCDRMTVIDPSFQRKSDNCINSTRLNNILQPAAGLRETRSEWASCLPPVIRTVDPNLSRFTSISRHHAFPSPRVSSKFYSGMS